MYTANGHKLSIPKAQSPTIFKGFPAFATLSKVQIMPVRSIVAIHELPSNVAYA